MSLEAKTKKPKKVAVNSVENKTKKSIQMGAFLLPIVRKYIIVLSLK